MNWRNTVTGIFAIECHKFWILNWYHGSEFTFRANSLLVKFIGLYKCCSVVQQSFWLLSIGYSMFSQWVSEEDRVGKFEDSHITEETEGDGEDDHTDNQW